MERVAEEVADLLLKHSVAMGAHKVSKPGAWLARQTSG